MYLCCMILEFGFEKGIQNAVCSCVDGHFLSCLSAFTILLPFLCIPFASRQSWAKIAQVWDMMSDDEHDVD